ncbi:MAG: tetratricopeptide repeat protein [Bacteroidetes bacterium]|nr:tetratricopeptide repeat protein [Bacteroidota bacterium]
MMKKLYILSFLFFVVFCAAAQPGKQAALWLKKAQLQEGQGLTPQAIVSYNKAIALNKNLDSAYIKLALLYARITQPDSAVTVLKKAVKHKPSFTAAYLLMGNIYRDNMQKYDEAIGSYLEALKTDSTNTLTIYGVAWCYNAKKEYHEAIKYALKALDIDNNYKPAYNELGHAYRQLGAFDECINALKQRLAVSYNDLPMLYIGYCYMELKKKDDAYNTYEELKKHNDNMAGALKKKLDAASW